MKRIKITFIIILLSIVAMVFCNKIWAETTNQNNTDNKEIQNGMPSNDWLENIGKVKEGKDYIVGDIRGTAKSGASKDFDCISVDDASSLLSFTANYQISEDDVYTIYQNMVKKGYTYNDKIKNEEDVYNVFDVNEDGNIDAVDATEILKFYACRAAGLIKD